MTNDIENECRCEPSDWAPPAGSSGDGSVAALAGDGAIYAATSERTSPDWHAGFRAGLAAGRACALAAQQQPLDADIAKILQDNLWGLYIEDGAQPAAEANPQR